MEDTAEKNPENKKRVFKDSIKRGNFFPFFSTIVLVGSGIFLFWLYSKIKAGAFDGSNGGMQFDPKDANVELLLLFPAFALIGLGGLIIFLLFHKVMKRSFILEESKIASYYKNTLETSLKFAEIKEVYRCRSLTNKGIVPCGLLNVLAYRETKEAPWKVIRPILYEGKKKNKGVELIQIVIDEYVKANLPLALEKIQQGQDIVFDYLEPRKAMISHLNNRDNFDRMIFGLSELPLKETRYIQKSKHYGEVALEKITLSQKGIVLGDTVSKIVFQAGDEVIFQSYDLGRFMGRQPESFEIGKIMLYIQDGREKMAIDLTRMVNGDLFVAAVRHLSGSVQK